MLTRASSRKKRETSDKKKTQNPYQKRVCTLRTKRRKTSIKFKKLAAGWYIKAIYNDTTTIWIHKRCVIYVEILISWICCENDFSGSKVLCDTFECAFISSSVFLFVSNNHKIVVDLVTKRMLCVRFGIVKSLFLFSFLSFEWSHKEKRKSQAKCHNNMSVLFNCRMNTAAAIDIYLLSSGCIRGPLEWWGKYQWTFPKKWRRHASTLWRQLRFPFVRSYFWKKENHRRIHRVHPSI